jgi:hypothetical protein
LPELSWKKKGRLHKCTFALTVIDLWLIIRVSGGKQFQLFNIFQTGPKTQGQYGKNHSSFMECQITSTPQKYDAARCLPREYE